MFMDDILQQINYAQGRVDYALAHPSQFKFTEVGYGVALPFVSGGSVEIPVSCYDFSGALDKFFRSVNAGIGSSLDQGLNTNRLFGGALAGAGGLIVAGLGGYMLYKWLK